MYKIIACILLTISLLFRFFLLFRAYKARNNPIPEELADVYDEETHHRFKEYSKDRLMVSAIFTLVEFVISLVVILTNVLALLSNGLGNPYVEAIVVIAFFTGVSIVPDFIHEYVEKMKVEEKYGFNKSTMKTLIVDQIKGLIISVALTIGITCLFALIYESVGDYILLIFTGVLFGFILIVAFLYPVLSKIFNKFTPLEEGELRDSLVNMLTSHGYQVKDIKVMDASKRTTKSNAYFAGFGKMKTIVLYDNILKVMTKEEIVAIFAHEMGHGLHKDTLKSSIFSLLNIAIIVTLLWGALKIPAICADFGFNGINYGFVFYAIVTIVYPFVSTIIEIIGSFFSRKHEYAADEQAVKEGYGEYLISGLKKLFREDLGDINPDPILVFLSYSHPTLLQRVRHIHEFEAKIQSEKKD